MHSAATDTMCTALLSKTLYANKRQVAGMRHLLALKMKTTLKVF